MAALIVRRLVEGGDIFITSNRWTFRFNRGEDSSGLRFAGMAFKGRSEHGVGFNIVIWNDTLQIHTEPRRTGYLLIDVFSSSIKGVLGEPRSEPTVLPSGMPRFPPGLELTTGWMIPEDKRGEIIRKIDQLLKESARLSG